MTLKVKLLIATIILSGLAATARAFIPGDIDGDGRVGFEDVIDFSDHWLDTSETIPQNLDAAGSVNMADFSLLSRHWLMKEPSLEAAEYGLQCGRDIAAATPTMETGHNYVSGQEADTIWGSLCAHLQEVQPGGLSVDDPQPFSDDGGSGQQIATQWIPYQGSSSFQIRFYRYDNDPRTIGLQCSGQDGQTSRILHGEYVITKDTEVLNYAIAGRGRIWLTGDTTIYGNIYSAWNRAEISPFEMAAECRVEGTINTVLALNEIFDGGYTLEFLDFYGQALFYYGMPVYSENGLPLSGTYGPADADGYLLYERSQGIFLHVYDQYGNLIPVNYANRLYDNYDTVQAYHEGICYDMPDPNKIPGLDIQDYSHEMYENLVLSTGGNIPASGTTIIEYYPHAPGDYAYPREGNPGNTWNLELIRHVYENMTFTNVRLPSNRNALFRNCTFNEILYIDCYKSTFYYFNNVRFENCTFNGVIITDTPSALKWRENCLYFTGTETFVNNSSIPAATILAPHFNIEMGNLYPSPVDNHVISGAVVGGIVDIRGDVQLYGTITSMCDTSQWSNGYVTDIGEVGYETSYIGTIEIMPDAEQLIPSGITSPIILRQIE